MLEGVKLNLVESVEDASAFMRWLGERRHILAFDTETEGLQFWRMNCRLAQFGDTETGWAIPFERWSGVVEEVFRKYEGRITGHNIRFDAHFMAHHGIDIGMHRCDDTMLKANALWPNRRMALKTLAEENIDPGAANGQHALDEAMTKGGYTWATVPIGLPAYWAYGAMDTVLAARLDEHMDPQIDAQGLRDVYELECAVSSVLFNMEERGANIDVAYCERKFDELTTYVTQLRAWCQDVYGVSPGSKTGVISRLQADGHVFTKRTNTGYALDEDVISKIDHPLAHAVHNVRKATKIANTYFKNFVDLQKDGKLHCSVRQVGAKTGRMSITDPALQTLPARGDGTIVRNAFIPSFGSKLVSIDYAQVEMRIFAHFAKEQEMLSRIHAGVDLHTAVAQVIFGTDHPTKAQRGVTKNANFAKVYGAGAAKFAQTAGITEEEGVAFYETYDSTFPGVRKFQQLVTETARQRYVDEGRAYVRAPSGRLHFADMDTLYKLCNYLIQGTAADVLKQKLVALDLSGFGPEMVLPIHDEVLFDFPEFDIEQHTHDAERVMEDLTTFSVPLVVEASAPMDNWEKS